MQLNIRIKYVFIICLIIILGLLSRKTPSIPLFVGDVLWAAMIFYMMRFFFSQTNFKRLFILSLLFCYFIEVSQLYQAGWINNLRNTTIGGLILGHGFLWSDILAYSFGVTIATIIEKEFGLKRRMKQQNY